MDVPACHSMKPKHKTIFYFIKTKFPFSIQSYSIPYSVVYAKKNETKKTKHKKT